jgi:hypothetical protein
LADEDPLQIGGFQEAGEPRREFLQLREGVAGAAAGLAFSFQGDTARCDMAVAALDAGIDPIFQAPVKRGGAIFRAEVRNSFGIRHDPGIPKFAGTIHDTSSIPAIVASWESRPPRCGGLNDMRTC